jgi:hypothetical protein
MSQGRDQRRTAGRRSFGNVTIIFLIAVGVIVTILQTSLVISSHYKGYDDELLLDYDLGANNVVAAKSTSTVSVQEKTENADVWNTLDFLSGGPRAKTIECPPHLVPFENHKGTGGESASSLIPRILHFSFKSRCLPRDYALNLKRWKDTFPNYSIVFHDDDAAQRLFDQEEWKEFPNLHRILNCVLYSGAMKIDIWRILILYRYGGVYSDIDNWPNELNQSTIPGNVSAFFLSDAYNRPSQWFMAVEPHHPMMYLTLHQIIKNVLALENIVAPRLVQTTGPMALRDGYQMFFDMSSYNQTKVGIFDTEVGIIKGAFDKTVLKYAYSNTTEVKTTYIDAKKGYDDIVVYNQTLNVTRAERVGMDSGGLHHWTKEIYGAWKTSGRNAGAISCMKHLEKLGK